MSTKAHPIIKDRHATGDFMQMRTDFLVLVSIEYTVTSYNVTAKINLNKLIFCNTKNSLLSIFHRQIGINSFVSPSNHGSNSICNGYQKEKISRWFITKS